MLKLLTANLYIFCVLTIYYLFLVPSAIAQVTSDNSLNTKVTVDGIKYQIENGTISGTNLFHSFDQFSVPTNGSAIFKNNTNIQNIFGRVTGGNISNIDGLIEANGTASLYLINPNGVIFGSGASLNIGGSFVTSTADIILFPDNVKFSATNTSTPPILSMKVPVGLQLGSNPGDIIVNGSGNELNLVSRTNPSINRSNRPVGLQVKDGQTLALVGGNVTLNGGNLTANSGRIEIGSVREGTVNIIHSDADTSWKLDYQDINVNNFQDVNLLSQNNMGSSLEVSSDTAGEIQIQGRNINVKDGSAILADTLKDGTGGKITLKATEDITVSGISQSKVFMSYVSTDVAPDATGHGGEVNIETKNLFLTDGGQINANTFSSGNAGVVKVTADDIEIIGFSPYGPSGLFSQVNRNATGTGGNIFVTTNSLKMDGGAQILVNTFGIGDGGNLIVKAEEIELIGTGVAGNSEFSTALLSSTERGSTGNAGTLTVETNSLKLTDGAQITASTSNEKNAGKINVQANDIELIGTSDSGRRTSGIFSFVNSRTTGNGGDLNITTANLKVADGAAIVTSTAASGKAGNIIVNATESIELVGTSSTGKVSGLFASAVLDTGDGGDIKITTDELSIKDGATINVSNFSANNPNSRPGEGKTGNLEIQAKSLLLDSSTADTFSSITASSATKDGGNISLQLSDSLVANNGSQILAETRGDDKGGNINITSKKVSLNSGAEISANSTGLGKAGNINILFERLETNNGKITATSEQTGGGNITLTATASEIFLRNNSLISTSVLDSNGGGGDIFITANVIALLGNSNIKANAVLGPGGNIQINTQGLFLSSDSVITASSQFGIDGEVEINNTKEEKINIKKLPATPLDKNKLVARSCSQQENSFVVAGKGGLPVNPSQTLRSQDSWVDLRIPEGKLAQSKSQKSNNSASQRSTTVDQQAQSTPSQIREAQGWIVNGNGKIELVVNAPTTSSHASQNIAGNCQS
ncbi:filamentous hemagglutinin N-terminal domain-containing protein [Calothrix rhizosoleniae]|uniref:two-partner secretion domain-containing protein n=1 Tax=Calothrix rhizosoleniae TaxID=888997 RepID=UPI000B49A8AB|nr:filamentous hemagglutinin N-terminal domain-containing protein [Calothrix rhizosoleniae]